MAAAAIVGVRGEWEAERGASMAVNACSSTRCMCGVLTTPSISDTSLLGG